MRYTKLMAFVLVFALCAASSGYADTTAGFGVTVGIEDQLELTGWVKEMGPGETDPGVEGTELDFPCTMTFGDEEGNLTSELSEGAGDAGGLYSPTWYAVFMVAKTSGRPYKIESLAYSLAGTSGTAAEGYDLDGSFILTPGYRPEDEWTWGDEGPDERTPQGPDPNHPGSPFGTSNGSGPQVLAQGINLIYDSGTGGASRILRAFYSIPPYPDPDDPPDIQARPAGWDIVDLSQPEGTYECDITITLTLKTP